MDFSSYAIIFPLVFLAGFVDAVAGGGGLISLPAYFIAGLPVHHAIATNKMSSCMGTLLATVKFAKDGLIPWKTSLYGVIFAFTGSFFGARLALVLDSHIFMTLMLVILPVTAFYVTRGKTMTEKEPFSFVKTLILSCAISFVIGIYDGFYGPGTGTFLILLLIGIAHVKLKEANGITKVINSTTNMAALYVFLSNGAVMISLGFIAGLFNMAGNYFGARFFEKGDPKKVKPIIIAVLSVFFIKILYELIVHP